MNFLPGILLLLVSLHGISVGASYPEKYRPLLEEQRIAQTICLRDTNNELTPLVSWSPAQLETLYAYLNRFEEGSGFPLADAPPYPWTTEAVYAMYFTRVAQSLYIEANRKVPWSILDFSESHLAQLFGFDIWYNSYYGQWVAGTIGVLNWDARRIYAFCRTNGITQASEYGTVMAFADWCRRHLKHAAGGDTPLSLYGYSAPVPPLDRILSGFTLVPEKPYRTFGCGCTSAIWKEVMRAMNIIVATRLVGYGYPGDATTYWHSCFEIPVVGLGVAHSDDFYTGNLNCLSGDVDHIVPTPLLFSSMDWLRDFVWAPVTLHCNGSVCNTAPQQALFNANQRKESLDVAYLTDWILRLRAGDIDSMIYPSALMAYLTDSYAQPYFPESARMEIWQRVDNYLAALGNGSWASGRDSITSRYARISLPAMVHTRLETAEGWNLVSLPVRWPDSSVATHFPGAVSGAFAYAGGYSAQATLTPGEGYWLKMPAAAVTDLNGIPVPEKDVIVSAGWNIIGVFEQEAPTGAITSTPPAIVTSSFYAYDNGYSPVVTLSPGEGILGEGVGGGDSSSTLVGIQNRCGTGPGQRRMDPGVIHIERWSAGEDLPCA